MIGTSGRAVVGAAIALVFGLGGCAQDSGTTAAGADQRQTAQPPPPSVLPAPTALAIANERSPSGAQEFVKYWFQTLNYATQTGDIAPLRQASDAGCQKCQDVVAGVRNSYSDGGYIQGGTYKVRTVTNEEFGLADKPVLSVSFDRSRRSGFAPDGQIRDNLRAASFGSCQITLSWNGRQWQALAVTGELLPG